jgi:glucose/arabinose dehydrogenase
MNWPRGGVPKRSPDRLLYLLTDENDGALLKIEPAQ